MWIPNMEKNHEGGISFAPKEWHMGSSHSPPGIKLFKCKWVFKNKFDADGYPFKYKSMLVAKNFYQVQGIDYNETFAPVAKMDSIRLV